VPTMTMVQALNSAMAVMLERNPSVLVFGQDVGYFGGVFRATEGLQKKFGPTRCFDAPIAEGGIAAVAIGMAAFGMRPIVEMQFSDYIYPAFDQLVSEAARLRYRSAGEFTAPLTVRAPYGGGIFGGPTHSQSPEAFFTHVPGLKVVVPSTPYDAKGLLISAVQDDDPVIFLEPKRLYSGPFDGPSDDAVKAWASHPASDVPIGYYEVALGKAKVVSEGNDVTILAYGTMVHVALAAAQKSESSAEVIDLRTLVPLDIETVTRSVLKTGRCIIVHEAPESSGFGAELCALVQNRCFYNLRSPIERVAGWDMAYPHSHEWDYFIGPDRVGSAIEKVMEN